MKLDSQRLMKRFTILAFVITLLAVLAACQPEPTVMPTPTRTPAPESGSEAATATPAPASATSEPSDDQPEPTATPLGPYGPEQYPADVNPLTGLPVEDPGVLERPPLLIKISNNPAVVRPQAGLNTADHIWEHQVEGFAYTRFTAVLLSQSPERVGPVRSGRLPDLELVPMYEGIYVASGYSTNHNDPAKPPRMRQLMLRADWSNRNFSYEFGYGPPYSDRIPQQGLATEHTLYSFPDELWKLAADRNIGPSSTIIPGLKFDERVPDGGTATTEAIIDYPGAGPRNRWLYDEESGRWLRWVDGEEHADQLTGEQVSFANVVIVNAPHYEADFIEDEAAQLLSVGVELTGEGDAVLLRDGQRYAITWRRANQNSMIQFTDASGQSFAFKPGNTWFQLADTRFAAPEIVFSP